MVRRAPEKVRSGAPVFAWESKRDIHHSDECPLRTSGRQDAVRTFWSEYGGMTESCFRTITRPHSRREHFHETEMKEQDWLTCDDSIPMLEFLQGGLSDSCDSLFDKTDSPSERASGLPSWKAMQRKLRLFACACIRRVPGFGSADHDHAIRISEQYADGLVGRAALDEAFVPLRKLPEPIPCDADFALSVFGPTDMVWEARLIEVFLTLGPELDVQAVAAKTAEIITHCEGAECLSRRGRAERSQQAHLLRDIFGNPFRLVGLDPSCLNEKTRAVAKTIYQKGQFANLPGLARALKKDAGCKNRELWDHCQWPIQHVRGCWVVDLVLGES
jgi:hypothetical protein